MHFTVVAVCSELSPHQTLSFLFLCCIFPKFLSFVRTNTNLGGLRSYFLQNIVETAYLFQPVRQEIEEIYVSDDDDDDFLAPAAPAARIEDDIDFNDLAGADVEAIFGAFVDD